MATDSIMGAARFALASGVVALLAKRLATLATSVAMLHPRITRIVATVANL